MKFRILNSQLVFFFAAGSCAVLDYLFYKLTLNFLGLFYSKIFGFILGVFVSFLINNSYTFKKKGKKIFKFALFFQISNCTYN